MHTIDSLAKSSAVALKFELRGVRIQLCGKAPRFSAFASHTKALKAFVGLAPTPCFSGSAVALKKNLRSYKDCIRIS